MQRMRLQCFLFLVPVRQYGEWLRARLCMAQVNTRLEFASVSRARAHCLFCPCIHTRSRLRFVHSLVGTF